MIRKSKYASDSIKELLDKLNPVEVLTDLGIDRASIEVSDAGLTSPCPAHSNGTDVTLVYENDKRRAYCREFKCPASKVTGGGGDLVWLYALVKQTSYDHAIDIWSRRLDVSLRQSRDETIVQRTVNDFKYIEIARFNRSSDDNALIPAQFGFGDQQAVNGRGVVIGIKYLEDFVNRYKVDLFQSRFLYDLSTKEAIDEAYRSDNLHMLSNYFIVFEARSSAEIVHSINQAIEIVEFLRLTYDIPLDAINILYSGKRIEIDIDYTIFGIAPKINLHEYFNKMTRRIAELASSEDGNGADQFSQINYSAYAFDGLTQIPGSAIAEGKGIHKIRLPYNVFKKTNYVRLYEMSQKRPPFAQAEPIVAQSAAASELFAKISSEIEGTAEEERDLIASTFYQKREPEEYDSLNAFAPQLLQRYFSERRRVIPTPSRHLNSLLGGGFQPGSLSIVAGFPGSGTTSFCLWCTNYIAQYHNTPCVFITLQQGIEEIYVKSLSQIGDLPSRELIVRRNDPESLKRDDTFNRSLMAAYERYQEFSQNVTVIEGSVSTDEEFLRKLLIDLRKRYKARGDTSSAFVVLDSLQLLLANINAANPDRQIDMNILTSRIKSLARELDISILATNEYLLDYHHFYPTSDISNKVIVRFYQDTQFADAVYFLVSQDKSLSNIIKYFQINYTRPSNQQEISDIVARLTELERQLADNPRAKKFSSTFSVLEVIKNRSGKRGKVMFIHERALSSFIPLEYREPDSDSEII